MLGESLLDVPQGSDFVAVAVGYAHSIALRADGTIVCWGWNFEGETDWPEFGMAVLAIAAGEKWSLALLEDGTLRAWGAEGQSCGDISSFSDACPPHSIGPCTKCGEDCASQHYQITAVPEPDLDRFFIAISATGHFGLALQDDGTMKAWGADDWCQVTNAYSGAVLKMSAGHKHGLVIGTDGTLHVWGNNSWGQRDTTSATQPQCTQVSPPHPRCPAQCCGNSGCDNTCYKPPPAPFPSVNSVLDFAGGYFHTTFQLANGSLFAFGKNTDGQCFTPAGSFVAFTSSYDHGLAIEATDADAYANCDDSTTPPILDANDILCFIAHYIHANPYADCNGDMSLTSEDIVCWYARFNRAAGH